MDWIALAAVIAVLVGLNVLTWLGGLVEQAAKRRQQKD